MKVAVSGANGFVGRSLVRALAQRGVETFGLVRDGARHENEIAIGDLAGESPVSIPRVRALVHLAARAHVMNDVQRDPLSAYRQTNVHGTRKLLRAADAAGVERFVFVSTIKVLGEETEPGSPFNQFSPPRPVDAYAISKLEAEEAVAAFCDARGMEWTIVRPTLIFGPGVGANFAQLMLLVQRGYPLPFAAIRNARSLLFVDNLSAFLAAATDHPLLSGRTVNLADPPALSTPQLIRSLATAMGRRTKLFHLRPHILELVAALAGKAQTVRRLTRSLEVETEELFREIDWHPPVPWDEALKQSVALLPQDRWATRSHRRSHSH